MLDMGRDFHNRRDFGDLGLDIYDLLFWTGSGRVKAVSPICEVPDYDQHAPYDFYYWCIDVGVCRLVG
jgi:hypothetical protein